MHQNSCGAFLDAEGSRVQVQQRCHAFRVRLELRGPQASQVIDQLVPDPHAGINPALNDAVRIHAALDPLDRNQTATVLLDPQP